MTDAPHTPPTTAGAPTWRDQLTRFFSSIRFSGLNRDNDRWLLGVCGAVARRTGLDPLIVRGIAIVLAIVGAPVFFAYALGWALLPDTSGRIHAEEVVRGKFTAVSVTSIAVLVVTMFSFFQGFNWGLDTGWILPEWLAVFFSVAWSIAITAGIVWLVVYLVRRGKDQGPDAGAGAPTADAGGAPASPNGTGSDPFSNTSANTAQAGTTVALVSDTTPSATTPPSAPRQPYSWEPTEQNRARQEQQKARREERAATRRASLPGAGFTAIVLGLALAAGAVAAGILAAGATTAPASAALAVGLSVTLGVIAIGVIVSGIRGRRGGALGGLAFLAGVSLLAVGVFPTGTQFVAVGDPAWRVAATSTDSRPGYALLAGQATIDLGSVRYERLAEDRVIDVWVALGETRIILPESTPVRVEAHAIVGGVGTEDAENSQQQNGLLLNETRAFNGGDSAAPLIRVWSYIGQVTIIEPTSTTSR